MAFMLKLSTAPGLVAVLSLAATPVHALDLPATAAPHAAQGTVAWAPGDEIAAGHKRHRHHDDGVDVGDILAGVLIIGGIAAIASAVDNSDDDYRQPAPRYPDPRRGDDRYDGARGLDRAASLCVDAIERDARVDTVDAVNRNARGWIVTGALYDGQGFTCSIGADGRIEAIDYGARGTSYDAEGDGAYGAEPRADGEDRQYDDAAYAAARARIDGAQPAYPGGPLPGEDSGEIDGDIEYGTGYRGTGR